MPPSFPGVVCDCGEAAQDNVIPSNPKDSGCFAFTNLPHIGSVMLQRLRKDPRIGGIKVRDHYWLATLLDLRFKGKVAEPILPLQREHTMKCTMEEPLLHFCR